ncbi:hypothetical protein [Kitasatospora herbaricolor]|uniref:hypothetical protein n=1 Tax=Kitasatospora herbaricolor TaxID=68217 RepID=UPI0036DC93AB
MEEISEVRSSHGRDLIRNARGESADLFAGTWNKVLRDFAKVSSLPGVGSPGETCLRAVAALMAPSLLVPEPVRVRPPWASAPQVSALRDEAKMMLRESGYINNNKMNSACGPVAERLAYAVDLAAYVAEVVGVKVKQPHAANYIGYWEAGQSLEIHLDSMKFSDINILLCVDRESSREGQGSSTVFVTPAGFKSEYCTPGEALIFDGTCLPHGRTPIGDGETVTLINFGFHAL